MNPSNGIMASADESGMIKIWNEHKYFIREIQFPEPVLSLCFVDNRGDLLVGHGQA